MQYQAVIGLEVHVQLKTNSKMFTRAACKFGEPPNTLTNPVVMGLPGTLPVMNKEAIELSIRTGLLFGCEIAPICKWDRKNYFYPDQPKNYQISQYDQPLCLGGAVEIELPGAARNVMGEHRKVRLTRIHLEEDVGKLTHFENDTLVDFNRAGIPLLEIVTEPDLFSTGEVVAFLNAIRLNMVYAGLSDCDMEKGQMRCDANVSVRPTGSDTLGIRSEMKNLNSIAGTRDSVAYEIRRQIRVLEKGGQVVQETRRWNAEQGYTVALRSKEEAHDYRYFPDPDLMPVKISPATLNRLREEIPERPYDRQRRFLQDYDLPYSTASVLCRDRALGDFFEEAVSAHNKPAQIGNLVANDLLRELSTARAGAGAGAGGRGIRKISEMLIKPAQMAELVKLVDDGVISKQIAQDLIAEMFRTGRSPLSIVEEKGLRQSTDRAEIESICAKIIFENPKPAEQFKAGNEKAINALKGGVMKATRGKANPALVDQVLRQLLA